MINKIKNAIIEECEAMMSGHFIPYHIAAFMMAILTTLLFSVAMTHSAVFEGKIAVIDLDSSSYSTAFIEKLNTSSYIEITEVYHTPIPVTTLLQHDRNIGVLYIPQGMEKAVHRNNMTFNVGYFADYSNMAQNGQALSNLNKIFSEIGAEQTGGRIATQLKVNQDGAEALMHPVNLVDRNLFNPTLSSTISICSAFIYFFSSIILGLTSLMIVGRLKVTDKWQQVLEDGPVVLISRLVPYALIYTTAITLVTSAIVVFGQMRFSGNYFLHLPSIFMTAMGIGMIAFILTWKAQSPADGPSKMILFVPPGFILGGALLATGMLPEWINHLKFIFPLTWQFEFWRDIAYRGIAASTMISTYGKYIIYLSILASIICILHYRSTALAEKHTEDKDTKDKEQGDSLKNADKDPALKN